jgi:hypothetical protein
VAIKYGTMNLRPLQFLQRSEVQGAINEGNQKIRFPIILPLNNLT